MADDGLVCISTPTEELISEAQSRETTDREPEPDHDDEDDQVPLPPPLPASVDTLASLDLLKNFLYSRGETTDDEFKLVARLEEFVQKCRDKSLKQQRITDFF